MAADVLGLLEQLLRSDAEVHGTRSFDSNTEPIAKLLQGGRPLRRLGGEAGAGRDADSYGQAPSSNLTGRQGSARRWGP
jgi:hypothetical protein